MTCNKSLDTKSQPNKKNRMIFMASPLVTLSEARHLKPSFCKWQFLINPTCWTQTKMAMILMALVWRPLIVAVTQTSMRRQSWKSSAESFVMHKKRHWQRRRQRATSGKLTIGTYRQLYIIGNTIGMILLPRDIGLPVTNSFPYCTI